MLVKLFGQGNSSIFSCKTLAAHEREREKNPHPFCRNLKNAVTGSACLTSKELIDSSSHDETPHVTMTSQEVG